MLLSAQGRVFLRVRRWSRTREAKRVFRTARRSSTVAGRAVLFGLAPSVLTDVVLDHKVFNDKLLAHDGFNTFVNLLIGTGIFDAYMLLKRD